MTPSNDVIASLREALKISPDNPQLRQILADALLGMGQVDEAEKEYRQALTLAPDNEKIKTGLARAFFQQGKNSQAAVIVESLVGSDSCPGHAHVLYARLLIRSGDRAMASKHYAQGIAKDSSAADSELAQMLGIGDGLSAPASPQPTGQRAAPVWGGDETSEETEQDEADVERPKVNFKDVGGMSVVKDEIRMKIIHPLAHPDLYKAYGKKIGGGILMYGPPGCGKTHLARATAGEIKAGFLSVGINDVLNMWIGNSERNLHEMFEQARRSKPCVLFFDEVDALAASRSDMRQSGARHLINQFLAEMDGIQANNDGLLILAATNAPWHVDSAFRRPGRFDHILFVPPPDIGARAAILRILMAGKPAGDIDYDLLASKSEGLSGADLKAVVDVAVENKLKQAMSEGVPTPLLNKDLTHAMSKVQPSTREWFASAKNYAMYSNQGGMYDDVLKYLKSK